MSKSRAKDGIHWYEVALRFGRVVIGAFLFLFVESQERMCRCVRSRAFSRYRPTRTSGRSLPLQKRRRGRTFCGRSSSGSARPTAICSRPTHCMRYVVLSALSGGGLAADGVARLTDSSAVRSDVAYQSIPHGDSAALRGMDADLQTFGCVVWAAAVVGIGGLHELSLCRDFLGCRPRASRTGGRAAAGGADGATFPFQTLTERVRLVGENCFATVSSGTAFCTDCGDAMPSEDADPDVRILQAQTPSVTMTSQRQAPGGCSKWRIARTSAQRRLWTQSTQTNSV